MVRENKQMKTKTNFFPKSVLAFLAVMSLLTASLVFAQQKEQRKSAPSHYLIQVFWDASDNSLALRENSQPVLTTENLLEDIGSGSQFYARVINFSNKAKVFESGDAKLFLGKWKPGESAEKTEVKITVPYFADGSKVMIFRSDDKKAVLSVDVSKLATRKTTQASPQANPAQFTGAQTYLIGGHTAAYWWTMRIIFLLILGSGGYFIWRWRKKKKEKQADTASVNLTQSKK